MRNVRKFLVFLAGPVDVAYPAFRVYIVCSSITVHQEIYLMSLLMIRVVLILMFGGQAVAALPRNVDWPRVGNDPGCMRYSPLDQINRQNVTRLKPCWTYHTRELEGRPGKTIECTPIVIDGVMFITTAYLRVAALDAVTGRELWQFDPIKEYPFLYRPASGGVNRGCATGPTASQVASDGSFTVSAMADCFRWTRRRASSTRISARAVFAIFVRSSIRRWRGVRMGRRRRRQSGSDTIIVGVSCDEGPSVAAPGDIRAFDVRTGKELWRFHTVPHPGEFGHETWEGDSWKNRGGANAWGGFSIDADRGLVFAGLGSATFDFYGGDRHGDNLFANCTIALDATTGKRVWHFQTLRHDIWDHDLPVYPNLVTVTHNGKTVDAVAQVTKTGYVFLFDRETGKPLFDIEERPVPASDVPGEQAAPTQPVPVKPPPFSVQFVDETNITDIGAANRAKVLARLRAIRSGPAFNPPSRQGTVVVPGFHGGANWSGCLVRSDDGTLYVNSNNVVNIITLVETKARREGTIGALSNDGLQAVSRSRGLFGDQAPVGAV